MNLYRQTIILFGVIVPVLIGLAVLFGASVLKSKVVESYNLKNANFKTKEQTEAACRAEEAKVINQRVHLERWTKSFEQETASAVTTNLREIFAGLPAKEIQQTSFERTNTNAGFGSASAQKSSQIRIALRGTFRTLQRALLELETRMPQLQLSELRMDPSANQGSLLNFQVTYTAWEK